MDRPSLEGYSTRDVEALLGLTAAQVRSYVRAGFLSPRQGARGELLFSFQDLILLRTAKGLLAASIPHRRILQALENLQRQLPEGRPLSGVRITAEGHRVVVRDGGEAWNPESGQALLDFEVSELARQASSFIRKEPVEEVEDRKDKEKPREPDSAEGWFERAALLEEADPAAAAEAYRQVLGLDPDHADTHLNLGRLLHERGDVQEAERHYRKAFEARPGEATAAYNLGVALQDLGRLSEAAEAYEAAVSADARLADAHYNLSGVYESLGQEKSALRHLKTYKTLVRGARG